MKIMAVSIFLMAASFVFPSGVQAYNLYYPSPNTISDSCEEEIEEEEDCIKVYSKRRFQEDYFLEDQFEDTSWPGRRDDELSDQLSR